MRLLFATAAAFLAVTSAAQAQTPRRFLTNAIEGDNSEMRLGRLAAQRGMSPGVREFGRALARDHADARRQAMPLARSLGVAPTSAMTPEARDEYRKLSAMRGRAFDREFASYMVQDHQQGISDFQDQADHGHGRVADLARNTLPALHKHLDMAQRLQNEGR